MISQETWDYSLGFKCLNSQIQKSDRTESRSDILGQERIWYSKLHQLQTCFSKCPKPTKKCHSELLPQGYHPFDFCKPKPSTKRILVRVQLIWMLVWPWLIWMLVRVQLIRMLVGVQLIWMPVGVWLIQMLVGVWSILMLVLESDWFG